jgi:excisionase family DNA binding protein
MAESIYLSLREAAEYVNLSKSFLYRRTMNKEIPFRKVGKKILFEPVELKAWVEAHAVVPAQGA